MPKILKKNEKGAAAVEFAFTLLFLFLFLGLFLELVAIILTHERVSFASFSFSRLYSVHRVSEAYDAVNSIDPKVYPSPGPGSNKITCKKNIYLPVDLYHFTQKGGMYFQVEKQWNVFMEPYPSGDNAKGL
jgi:hypothetical protein